MKRARQASPGSWDRKLLEVEEKDPNRWRHSGYKQLYIEGSQSPSPSRRSRTPVPRRSRSPIARRSRSPGGLGRRSRSPVGLGRRSPGRRSRSTRRSPRRSPRRNGSPRRHSPSRSPVRRRSPRPRTPPPTKPASSSRRVASPRPRARPRPVPGRPPSPPPRKSSSGSSDSSCSDESCSVCSAKNKKLKAVKVRSKSKSPPPRPVKKVAPPPKPVKVLTKPLNSGNAAAKPSSLALQPTRELLKAREASKRTREEKVLEWQRSQLAVNRPPPIHPRRIKREGEKEAPSTTARVSPTTINAALAARDDSSSASDVSAPQKLTLSERFGKMAQWSADRSARLENMKITRRSAGLHVRIERPEGEEDAPPETYELDPAPVGSYPEELLAVAPVDMPSWDDVRVRYDYYKKRGYLRGLTLADYVKWEEWWYKYQEWLKRERAYERWADGEVRRERRRRGGRHRRRS